MSTTAAPPAVQPNGTLQTRGASTEVEKTRAIAETMAAIEVARRFPRDVKSAIDRIIQACTRPSLAETALYTYARGGTEITGPSIRMAEAIAQNYGNMQFGVREIEQRNGESTVEAYAWDVETNTRASKTFQVQHVRHTRERTYALSDPRDIYELVANMGARRLRACILSVVPGDIVELAVDQVETTLRTKVQVTPELVQSLIQKFADIGVTKEMLEARIQRRMDAITPAQVVQLGKNFNAIRDGMGSISDYFQVEKSEAAATPAEAIKDTLRNRAAADATAEGQTATPPAESAPAADEKSVPPDNAAPTVADDKDRRAELRNAIANVWKDVPAKAREAIVTREYGRKTLLDLNAVQLEELLARLPETLSQS